ncbi:MAG: hypothetical protein V7756_03000 [Halopseudomonas sp.]|uniref:hypothetical protein n=1 Tax=Halopseudomonas sp. TaxID=2901191 RepID=UPI0030026F01
MQHELFWASLAIFLTGVLFICAGFSRREDGLGIALLWVGAACMLGLVFYHIPKLLHLT